MKAANKSQKHDGGSDKPKVTTASQNNPGGMKKAKSKSSPSPSRKLW